MKKYGIIVADNGRTGTSPASRTTAGTTTSCTLRNVHGSTFEAVDLSGLMINPDSGQANVATGVSLNGVTLSPSTVTGGQITTQNAVTR